MRRLGRLGFLGALLALCLLVPAASAGASVPIVAPGHTFAVRVGGFAGHGSVRVQLMGSTTGRRTVRSDGRGRVRVSYRAPTVRGRYRLLVSGPARSTPSRRPVRPSPTAAGDTQVIAVTVPLVVGVPFQVGPGGSGILGGGTHTGGSGRTGGSGLADTGTDVRAPLILAAALCALGLAATLGGRRRARS